MKAGLSCCQQGQTFVLRIGPALLAARTRIPAECAAMRTIGIATAFERIEFHRQTDKPGGVFDAHNIGIVQGLRIRDRVVRLTVAVRISSLQYFFLSSLRLIPSKVRAPRLRFVFIEWSDPVESSPFRIVHSAETQSRRWCQERKRRGRHILEHAERFEDRLIRGSEPQPRGS